MTASRGNYTEQPGTLFNQGLFEESTVQKHRLGTIRQLDDGRRFVYALTTAADLAAGIAVSKAVAPQDATVAAADVTFGGAAGSKTVSVTLSGTPTANQYRDGFLTIKAGAGICESYKIAGNTADDNPATGRCTFYLYDALATLWVAGSTTIGIYENPYSGVLINPSVANAAATTGERILGVTVRSVTGGTAAKYVWLQTWGLASVLMTASTAGAEANERQLYPGTTDGTFQVVTGGDMPTYGETLESADLTTGENTLVYLMIS